MPNGEVPTLNIVEAHITPKGRGVLPKQKNPMRTGRKHKFVTARTKGERKTSHVVSTSNAVGITQTFTQGKRYIPPRFPPRPCLGHGRGIQRAKLMNNHAVHREPSVDKEEISIHLDADLLDQIKHLTNDPSKVIETAIRQWLRGERDRDDELTRTLDRNPPVPPRGEWND